MDELYNNKVKFYCSSSKDLDHLAPKKGNNAYDEEFALDRCISRLVEMQTKKYLEEESYLQTKQKSKIAVKSSFEFNWKCKKFFELSSGLMKGI